MIWIWMSNSEKKLKHRPMFVLGGQAGLKSAGISVFD